MQTKDEKYMSMLLDAADSSADAQDPLFFEKFSTDLLYRCLHRSVWNKLGETARLSILQEFENRQARLDGRRPIKILAEEMPLGSNGYHATLPDGSEVIGINTLLIKKSKISAYTAADALATVLHEGRHAFQHHSYKTDNNKVPEQVRLEWGAVMAAFGGVYMSPEKHFLVYVMQSIEMDARRFARKKISEISERLTAMGMPDANFSLTCHKLRARETRYIAEVRETLTLEQIDAYEKLVLEHFHLNNPSLKLDKIRLFDHVRLILTRTDINNLQDLLDLLDKHAEEKLGLQEEKKLNQIADKMPGLGGRFGG